MLRGFPGGASGKEPAYQCRRLERCGFDSWVGKMPWRRAWQPTPVFLPENPMDSGTWWATVHRAAKSWIQLSDREYTEIQENEQFRGMVIRDPSQVYLS